MLVPEDDRPPRYVLLTDSERADQFAAEVERRLCESVHYDYCRRLGQLAAVEGVHIDDAQVAYLNACQQQGQRAGDVKPRSLMTEFGWRERMTGRTGQQNEVAHAG